MRKGIITFIILLSALMTAQVIYAGEHEMDTTRYCPVSKERLEGDTDYAYEYMGKTYYFCCPKCIEEFKKNPEKYIDKNNKKDIHDEHNHHSH